MLNAVIIFVKDGLSARPDTAELIVSIPNIRIAKPSRILPISFFFDSPLLTITRTIPIAASIGENEEGFRSFSQIVLPSIPVSESIHEVMVVPMLAPIMIPTACESFMIPELTNPTTITVVADEDCITAVTPAPKRTAKILLVVNFSRIVSNLPPAILDRPLPIIFIPYRNSDKPPIILSKLKMSIQIPSL